MENYDKFFDKRRRKLNSDLFDSRIKSFPIWLRLYHLLYAYCSAITLVYLVFQYIYDINLRKHSFYMKSSHFQNQNQTAIYPKPIGHQNYTLATNHQDRSALLNYFKTKAENARYVLVTFIGAPFLDHTFAIEFVYVYILYITIVVYIETGVYNYYRQPFDMRVLKSIYDRNRCVRFNAQLIVNELNTFFLSGRNLINLYLNTVENQKRDGRPRNAAAHEKSISKSDLMKVVSDHQNSVQQSKMMALNNELQPANRHPEWIDHLTVVFNILCVSSSIGTSIFVSWYWYATINLNGWRRGALDWLFLGEFLIPSSIASIGTIFYLTLFVVNIVDYIYLVVSLNKTIRDLINQNSGDFLIQTMSLEQERLLDAQELRRRLNLKLLSIYLNYKIFMRQLKFSKPSIRMMAMLVLQIQLLAPVFTYIQLPLINPNYVPPLMSCNLFFLLLCDFCMAPICYLHSRCLDLSKTLSSLLAHSIELDAICKRWRRSATKRPNYVYDKHIMSLLSKELIQAENFENQFTISLFGYPLKYTTFLRVHIVSGLILLYSISTGAKANAEKSLLANSFTSLFF